MEKREDECQIRVVVVAFANSWDWSKEAVSNCLMHVYLHGL